MVTHICVFLHTHVQYLLKVCFTNTSFHCSIPCELDLISDILPFCCSYWVNSLFQWASTLQSVSFTCHGEIKKSIVNYYGFNSQLSCLCQMCHCVCIWLLMSKWNITTCFMNVRLLVGILFQKEILIIVPEKIWPFFTQLSNNWFKHKSEIITYVCSHYVFSIRKIFLNNIKRLIKYY